MAPGRIVLSWHNFELAADPALGGSVAWFRHQQTPLLLGGHTLSGEMGTDGFAAFPLIPFSGRIRNGTFTSNQPDGRRREVVLPANTPHGKHAIHGQTWQLPWQVRQHTNSVLHLTCEYTPGVWPWRYLAEQYLQTHEHGFTLTLRVTNLSDEHMPSGLGWHPYLPRGDAQLSAALAGQLRSDAEVLPVARDPHPGFADTVVASQNLDHCFYGWTGTARVTWPEAGLQLVMQTAAADHLVVFVPPSENYFCIEPTTHMNNAPNWTGTQPTGWRTLAPGEAQELPLDISVSTLTGEH